MVDAGLGALFASMVAVELVREPPARGVLTLVAVLLTLTLAASLAFRRRAPLAACLVGVAALTAESALHVATELSPLASWISSYSLGLHPDRTRARWGLPIVVVGVIGFHAFTPGLRQADPVELASVLLVWSATWAVGYSTARRREEQERARVAVARQIVVEEGMRISRELHDVVGHTVNLLVVQAGAARLMLDRNPAETREILRGMEQVGRETLTDLDRVLASLRAEPPEEILGSGGPRRGPGLAELPALVNRFADSGVKAALVCDPTLRLPPDLDLSAYRIVQEALTNTLKHAAPCSATVTVRRSADSAVIEVVDTGPGPGSPSGHGRGLRGMRERVTRSGGTLEYGGGDRGGFQLRAVLPLP